MIYTSICGFSPADLHTILRAAQSQVPKIKPQTPKINPVCGNLAENLTLGHLFGLPLGHLSCSRESLVLLPVSCGVGAGACLAALAAELCCGASRVPGAAQRHCGCGCGALVVSLSLVSRCSLCLFTPLPCRQYIFLELRPPVSRWRGQSEWLAVVYTLHHPKASAFCIRDSMETRGSPVHLHHGSVTGTHANIPAICCWLLGMCAALLLRCFENGDVFMSPSILQVHAR